MNDAVFLIYISSAPTTEDVRKFFHGIFTRITKIENR